MNRQEGLTTRSGNYRSTSSIILDEKIIWKNEFEKQHAPCLRQN